jgi:hypothetical protein
MGTGVFVMRVNEFETFQEGSGLLSESRRSTHIRSPFRSEYFVMGSIFTMCSVVMIVYLICIHWRVLGIFGSFALVFFIGALVLYQWWRAFRWYSVIRKCCSEVAKEEVCAEPRLFSALGIAALGISNLMLYAAVLAFVALTVIGALLTHLDGLK